MEKADYTKEQARMAAVTGHYDYMAQALAVAVNLVPAWRLAKDMSPCPLFDVFRFAKRWDEEHPRKEGDHGCFFVSREGAIGYTETGLEFQVKWIFIPMEPGEERDAIVKATLEEYNKAEEEAKRQLEAEAAAAAKTPDQVVSRKPRFCKYCGTPFKSETAKFCPGCGKPRE